MCVCARALTHFACSRALFSHTRKHTHTMTYTSRTACMQKRRRIWEGNPRLGSRHNVTICQLALSKSICDTRLQEQSKRTNIPPRARRTSATAAIRQLLLHQGNRTYGSGSTWAMSSLLHSFHAAGLTGRGADSPAESSTDFCTWLASAASLLSRARNPPFSRIFSQLFQV
jgi:hypothetical protein